MATTYDTTQAAAAEPIVADQNRPAQYQPQQVQIDIPQQPETRNYVELSDENGQPSGYRIFNTEGNTNTKEEFAKVAEQYGKDGTVPEGFTVLPPGAQQFMRRLFEAGNRPIQEAAKDFGQTWDEAIGYQQSANKPFIPNTPEQGGGSNVNAADHLRALAHMMAQAPAAVASTFKRPEDAAAMAGQVGATALTSGLGLVPQALAAGAGAGLGYIAGAKATGSPWSPGQATVHALLATGTQGAVGALKSFMGYGLSQQARQGMAKDLAELLQTKFKNLANDPAALHAIMSTESGLSDIVQLGFKGIRQDWQEIADTMIPTLVNRIQPQISSAMQSAISSGQLPPIPTSPVAGYVRQRVSGTMADKILYGMNQGAPRILSKAAATELRGYSKTLHELGNEFLENITDKQAILKVQAQRDVTIDKMKTVIKNEFYSSTPQIQAQQIAKLDALVNEQRQKIMQWMDSAELLSNIKQANGAAGFNPQKFQQLMMDKFKQNPGSMMNQGGIIAGRGADITQGIDTARGFNIPIPFGDVLRKFGINLKIPLGTKYVGKVPYQNPAATSTGASAIASYFSHKENR